MTKAVKAGPNPPYSQAGIHPGTTFAAFVTPMLYLVLFLTRFVTFVRNITRFVTFAGKAGQKPR